MGILKLRTYECPDCEGQFDFRRADEEPLPNFCPLCGQDMTGEPTQVPGWNGATRTNRGRSADQVYRQLEDSSAARAAQVASDLGVPVSEVSHLKTTDMKDNLRQGDTSIVLPRPSAPQVPAPPAGMVPIPQNRHTGAAYAANTRAGPYAGAGNAAVEGLRRNHGTNAAVAARRGEVARHGKG